MLRNTALAAMVAAGLALNAAEAAEIYDWSFTPTETFGTPTIGNLTGTLEATGNLITALTGTSTVLGAIGLAPRNFGADNQLPLTTAGILLTAPGGFTMILGVNQAGFGDPWVYQSYTPNTDVFGFGIFTATLRPTAPVPEPMSLALFALGLAGLAAARRATA